MESHRESRCCIEQLDPDTLHLTDTQLLLCRLGCCLFPNGTTRSFYEVSLNGTAFLTFHVPSATWELRWPRRDPVATYARRELMKYTETTHNLQHFLNTTCVDILRAQSPQTGVCQAQRGAGGSPCSQHPSHGN